MARVPRFQRKEAGIRIGQLDIRTEGKKEFHLDPEDSAHRQNRCDCTKVGIVSLKAASNWMWLVFQDRLGSGWRPN